jgi:hypothetical protein
MADDDMKHEDGGPDVRMADAKPTYKSWKKKYRKMRIKFDQKMSQGEDLYQQEVKAMRKIKQLAIYNESVYPWTCPFSSALLTFRAAASSIYSQTSTIGHRFPRRNVSMSASTFLLMPKKVSSSASTGSLDLALALPNH